MTTRIFKILLIALIFQSCLQKNEGNSNTYITAYQTNKEIEQKVISDSNSVEDIQTMLDYTCNCNWVAEKMTHYTDLTFSNNGKHFNTDSLTKWMDNPERLKIKSLRLKDFDTIPSEMAIFENVESVYLEAINNKNVQGLEVFPRLRILKAEEERFEFSEETKWIRNIEVIHVNKTKFSGLKSFKQIPKLREIKLSFSGFDNFPSDFETLKCLSYFQTGAHNFCEIDLTQLDFSKMACLKYVEFQSWRGNLNGIPSGIGKIEKVKISHPNLTKEEKEELNKTSG
ncbi:hypothetical protein [Flammeovirga sp. SJP92]|uniref:hypothetical protein n=1 Tax=Flammeovirga sp. SJP92 TaxID=1775430 RepID=UPI0007886DF3|nr:hypothetical protein [Flammeovirga sp. SJP92]KXX66939.1 hypothetical protein AVL50_29745 [Flammeovirga sp. SJP92]